MNGTTALARQLENVAAGDPWYGDSIAAVLTGVSAGAAAQHPIAGAHSIWELVLHLTSWTREVRRRLVDGVWREPEDGDWPAMPEPTEAHWRRDLGQMQEAHGALRETVLTMAEARLDEQLGTERDRALGTGVTFGEMLHGLLQHDAYHLGQISLLKRAVLR